MRKNVQPKQSKPCKQLSLFSNTEYQARQDRVRGFLARHSISGCLLTSAPTIAYLTGFDTQGCSAGLAVIQRHANLILPQEERARALRQSLPVAIAGADTESDLLLTAQKFIEGKRVAIECDEVTVTARKAMQDVFVGTDLIDLSEFMKRLRAQKTPEERHLLAQLSSIAEKTLKTAEKALQKANSSLSLASQMHKQIQQEILKIWPDQPLAPTAATVLVAQNTDGYNNPQTDQIITNTDVVVLSVVPQVGAYVCPQSATVQQRSVSPQARLFEQKCRTLLASVKYHLRAGLTGDEIATTLHGQAKSQGIKLNESFSLGYVLDLSACRADHRSLLKLRKGCSEKLRENMVVVIQLLLAFPPKTSVRGFFQAQEVFFIQEDGATSFEGLSEHKILEKQTGRKTR